MVSDNITLRAPEPEDVDRIYMWENGVGADSHGTLQAPVSRHMIWEYVRSYDANPMSCGQAKFIIMAGETAVGMLDLYDIDGRNRNVKAGILIGEKYRGKGYAAAALKEAEKYLRDSLGMNQVAAIVAADNSVSRRLFENAGYSKIAELPAWIRRSNTYVDGIWYQLSLNCTED